jgi:DNA-binding response OmpR family regulator
MSDKILIVDDELAVRELLEGFLTEEGYDVVMAADGEEAIELAARENPQVILLDIDMPGIDGIEVCKRLKAKDKTRFIPVIIATGLGNTYMEALEAGAEEFVSKPFHLVELSIRVRSMLSVRHLTDELDRAAAYIRGLQQGRPGL